MIKSRTLAVAVLSCLVALVAVRLQPVGGQEKEAGTGRLRHIVLFKFKNGTSDDQIRQVIDAFRALPGKIDAIEDFEYGTDVGVENKSQGFTHCFFVTFRDAKGRDAYLPHPAHKAFGQLVGPLLDRVLVVDYHVQR